MSVDPRLIHLYSYYRDAELRGSTLLLKLILRMRRKSNSPGISPMRPATPGSGPNESLTWEPCRCA
jgi:hypothetical protein